MQFEVVFLLLFGFLSSSHSAPREGLPLLSPGGIGGIFEGINSETIIRGPDGSEITSEQKGGAVIRDDGLTSQPIIVADSELTNVDPILTEERLISAGPVISSTGAPILVSADQAIASPGPILASPSTLLTGETYVENINTGYDEVPLAVPQAPIIEANPIEIVQQDPPIIETEIIEAPDVESDLSSDLKGPSGRVITRGSASIVSGPASTTITEPRKIIVAPPKIAIRTPVIASATIPLQEILVSASLPTVAQPLPEVTASSIASLQAGSYEASSTLVPSVLSYSSTGIPAENVYSTTATPLVNGLNGGGGESTRIDLGVNDLRQSIPVVEYSSSNGVINSRRLLNGDTYSSTEAPIISSTWGSISSDELLPSEGPSVPTSYLVTPQRSQNLAEVPLTAGLASSTITTNVQRIPRIEDNINVDGRVGELSQNEITSYDTRQQYLGPPDLSQAEYIAPALARNGIDASQVNLASVPLSEVTRYSDDVDQGGYNSGYLANRYERHAKRKRSN